MSLVLLNAPAWIVVAVVAVVVLVIFGEGAYREWDRADCAAQRLIQSFRCPGTRSPGCCGTAATTCPRPPKAGRAAKDFAGPTDPQTVSGAAWGEGDTWRPTPSGTKFNI